MTSEEMWRFSQLARRITPRGHDEAQLLELAIAWLEMMATKNARRELT
jgi:hypothetical protein